MLAFIQKCAVLGMVLVSLWLPRFAIAQTPTTSTPPSQLTNVQLTNPLNTTDPRTIIATLIQAILSIIGSLALLMFVYGGFLWITSFGESKRIERGKTIIVWAIAGLAIIASAYVIVNAVIKGLTTGSAT